MKRYSELMELNEEELVKEFDKGLEASVGILQTEENDILTHDEKQIVLYFKGHFQETDMMKDLQVLVEPIYGNGLEGTSERNIYDTVLRIFFKLRKSGHITVDMQYFMENLFLGGLIEGSFNGEVNRAWTIRKMRSYIMRTRAEGLKLGKPDGSLLPLYNKEETK